MTELQDAQELMKIFQDFYTLTGRLLLSNGLLDAPPGESKINMKQLYDLFKNTNSRGIVSLPFLALIQYYLEKNDHSLIRNATTELYSNLSYMTLSGARDFQFDAVSDLIAHVSFLLKKATVENNKMREIENQVIAKKINDGRIFEPKIADPLGDVIEIIGLPDPEHKKSMYSFVEPTVQTADEIDKTQKLIDGDFIDLQTKFDRVNNLATEQKKHKKIEDTIETVIDHKNPFNTFDDFWWEDDLFNNRDSQDTIDVSKNILDKIQNISENILRNIRPVNNRTVQEITDDDFIPIDDRTQQELEDDDYNSLESENEIENIDVSDAWDPKKTTITNPGPIIKLSTEYNKKVKVANKIKNKYLRKKIGQRNKSNKISAEWLKTAGYLDTKDQDKINYMFVPPRKEETNKIPDDAGHFVTTEIDSTDFKKENLASKVRKYKTRKPYISKEKIEDMLKDSETVETINILEDIATLDPGKNIQLAAKKISEKYKKLRETNARK